MQLEDEMKKQNLTKEEFAKRMETSRSALDRLLDPSNLNFGFICLKFNDLVATCNEIAP